MSEYQYYEFQAIDQLLNAEQQAYLRKLSSRVELTSRSAIYTYSYSSFRADPLELLKQHFDAFLYVANWGSKQLAFRFPRNALNPDELKAYFAFDEMTLETSGDNMILNIEFNPEDGYGGWIEGNGILGSLISLRDDLLRGDLRALYIAWLKAALWYEETLNDEYGEYDEEEEDSGDELARGDPDLIEPPLPAGLQELTPALRALIEFLEIDEDLVTAAAQASPPLKSTGEPYEEWVAKLSLEERDAFLVRLARGEARVHTDLLSRLREVGKSSGTAGLSNQPRRAFSEVKAAAREVRERRLEEERKAAERKRLAELEKLAKRESEAWQEVAHQLSQRTGSGYDAGVTLLAQLRDLAVHHNRRAAFDQRLGEVAGPFLKSKTLQERMRKQDLL
jgi:hypothetical protein